jgi:hypothetical protein
VDALLAGERLIVYGFAASESETIGVPLVLVPYTGGRVTPIRSSGDPAEQASDGLRIALTLREIEVLRAVGSAAILRGRNGAAC